MKPFLTTFRLLGAVALVTLDAGLPASADEPEVELHCEIRPTRAAAARASAARFRSANERILRAELANDLAETRMVSSEALASRPTFGRTTSPSR